MLFVRPIRGNGGPYTICTNPIVPIAPPEGLWKWCYSYNQPEDKVSVIGRDAASAAGLRRYKTNTQRGTRNISPKFIFYCLQVAK